jgi:hypothetical protein
LDDAKQSISEYTKELFVFQCVPIKRVAASDVVVEDVLPVSEAAPKKRGRPRKRK